VGFRLSGCEGNTNSWILQVVWFKQLFPVPTHVMSNLKNPLFRKWLVDAQLPLLLLISLLIRFSSNNNKKKNSNFEYMLWILLNTVFFVQHEEKHLCYIIYWQQNFSGLFNPSYVNLINNEYKQWNIGQRGEELRADPWMIIEPIALSSFISHQLSNVR